MNKEKVNSSLGIKITPTEKVQLEQVADREHRSVSSLVRLLIIQFLEIEYDREDLDE